MKLSKSDYHVLCIDDDPDFLVSMKFGLENFYRCSTVSNIRDGLEFIQREAVDLVLLDINLGDENGLDGLRQLKRADASLDVVMVSGYKDAKMIVDAIRAGASDYISKPFEIEELLAVIEKSEQVKQVKTRNDSLIIDLKKSDVSPKLLGISKAFRELLDKTDRLKGYNANILIEGESGTGKELLARYIHNLEANPRRPFIAINCAAIPDTLIESELFGYEKGSFTGATCRRIGKFELANGGDIFLDEISALKPELQAKILRVLQEKEICRIGGSTHVKVDFRVISATNENLDELVNKGLFRMDLFHRLRIVNLRMPALKERVEDIPLLVSHFLGKHARPGHSKEISPEALEIFKQYRWPGNIRELENLVHNLIIMAPNGSISPADLPDWLKNGEVMKDKIVDISSCAHALTLKECVKRAEKIFIEHTLKLNSGNKSKAANALDISRTTFHAKIKELGIER